MHDAEGTKLPDDAWRIMSVHPAPPFDPELAPVLAAIADRVPPTLTLEMVPRFRALPADPSVGGLVDAVGAVHDERSLRSDDGAEIVVSVFRRAVRSGYGGPGILYLHGGGMLFGNRFGGVQAYLPLIESHDGVVVAVEYRLAPEHPDPIPLEDGYGALCWMSDSAAELGIDPARLLIAGQSAGAGLAAGVALLARERGGPVLRGQVLVSPMLDDRDETVSTRQVDRIGVWDRQSNLLGWSALLGDRRGRPDVGGPTAPARAVDLTGLPPAFISAGSSEVFRDEAVAFASRIWACGGVAELHVWPGGFHGFENFAPQAALSLAAAAARDGWLHRLLSDVPPDDSAA
ncbi:alpha/beta hydrolase fold domain-containing protein [Microbacterium sp. DT81.1]|uniref:alpha/beta hydrolase fold domain-containing protein n=1 Tax=Microbacterium sp. DT81.1 TaxID=3393413 RepID=UPI003CFA56F0